MQRPERLKRVRNDRVSARVEVESHTVLRERVAELTALAEDLTAALEALPMGDLPKPSDEFDFYDEVRRFEVWLLSRTLERTQGCQRRAAKLLRLNPSTLNSKLKNLKIGPWEQSHNTSS